MSTMEVEQPNTDIRACQCFWVLEVNITVVGGMCNRMSDECTRKEN